MVRSGGERTVFREVEGADAVAAELCLVLPTVRNAVVPSIDVLVQAERIHPFAEFSTVRSRFRLGRCAIDADVASFGHSVVELEVMCCNPTEVPEAEAAIERVATQLGMTPLGMTGGKLETFIRQRCPAMLASLVEVGILSGA
uniref:CYTH domain-containing protein n=1 Tax=Coccolithus braarudii TaxID=221442 RepID=A0A7S0LFR6_9EUKA|mmetsp:Transcript_36291/g.77397  ORF Transcript_36291/g.77397 Transcript_36291/m.77397 type:complete len:143 (+) Transcript_36291:201-629(+)